MQNMETLNLTEIDSGNWRDVYHLEVREDQKNFVAEPGYYLNLCHYGKLWNPLAIVLESTVIGFIMWAVDDADGSCWIGGFIIGKEFQGKGYGKKALSLIMDRLAAEKSFSRFALSCSPDNGAVRLYRESGFRETGEKEDDEIVLRLSRPHHHRSAGANGD